MGIQCLNWKIIGQCLEADRSSHSPLLKAYNRPLTDSWLSQSRLDIFCLDKTRNQISWIPANTNTTGETNCDLTKFLTKWILPFGGNDKIRDHLLSNPIYTFSLFTIHCEKVKECLRVIQISLSNIWKEKYFIGIYHFSFFFFFVYLFNPPLRIISDCSCIQSYFIEIYDIPLNSYIVLWL